MDTATAESTNETTQRNEMNEFYRALAIAQANIFLHLRKAADDEDLRKRAAEITEKLETLFNEYTEPEGGKCGDKVWNPVTHQCE